MNGLFVHVVTRTMGSALKVTASGADSFSVVAWRRIVGGALVVGALAPLARAPEPARAASTTVVVDGRGNGHGIGLSQWGAYGYAVDHGWSAEQILSHYYGGTVAGTAAPIEMTVRLTALDDAQTAVVHPRGQLVVDGVAGGPWPSIVIRETAERSYTVWARSDGEVCAVPGDPLGAPWTVIATGLPSVAVRPATDTSASADHADLLAVCDPAGGRVRSYRGWIRAANGTVGENRTINHVPLEQYLRPIVATEMSASWATRGGGRGMQALRAQAVAARSYALAENKYSYAKTCDDNCQAYFGAATRTAIGSAFVRVEQTATDEAVSSTAGMVRRVGSVDGAIAYTMFSASNGGRTAGSTLGFGVVDDLGDGTSLNPYHTWSVTLTTAQIETAWPSIGTYVSMTVTSRSGGGEWGGRVDSMTVTGSTGTVTISGDQFRRAMGLRSTWFSPRGAAAVTPSPAPASPAPATPVPAPGAAVDDACGGRVPPPVTSTTAPASPPARLQPLAPVRLVDTRESGGALERNCTLVVTPPVSAGTTAVAVNVTTVNSRANGFVTAYPCGIERPLTATVQPLVGLVVGGAALVPLSANGTFCVFANVPTDVVIDLFGAYSPSATARFEPIAPERRFDSRPSGRRLATGDVVRVQMGTPQATAVALTVHALDAAAGGFVTVWPCDTDRPWVSGANVAAGGSVTNHVEVATGASGEVCFYVSAPMHLAVDLSGWYGTSGSSDLHAVSPFRLADTREGHGWSGMFSRLTGRSITVTGGAVPASATAIAGQITAVDATGAGYLTVHPCSPTAPDLSMLRYPAGRNVAVLVTGATDASGRWCLVTNAATHVVIDVTAWFG